MSNFVKRKVKMLKLLIFLFMQIVFFHTEINETHEVPPFTEQLHIQMRTFIFETLTGSGLF